MDYSLFVILAPLGVVALATALVSVWPRRNAPAARHLLATGFTISGWLLFNTGETLAYDVEAKLLWAKLTYFFIATAPFAWLTFTLAYTSRWAWLLWRPLTLLAVVPVLTIVLALTNESHGLIWQSYTFDAVPAPGYGPLPDYFIGMNVDHGAAYWLFAVYAYACVLASSVLIIREHFRSFPIYRRQSAWMVFGVLSPFIANIIYLTGAIPGLEKDFGPIAFALGTGIFTLNVRRYGLLDLKPFARNVLVDKMRDGMIVLDALNRVVDFNPAAAPVFKTGSDDVIGSTLGSVLRPEHSGLAGHLDGSQPDKVELCLPLGNATIYYDLRITPLTDAKGQVTGRLLLLYDVTQRRAHEEALREVNRKLQSEYEELDAFAHTVAHDLNNPVHTIRGFSQILEEDYDSLSEELRRDALRTISRTSNKMQQIIRELLLLASVRRQQVETRPVDMEPIVEEVLERFGPTIAQRNARIEVRETWPIVEGYGPWIEEVWSNYVANALKYGGTEPYIRLGCTEGDDGTARFWVRDAGPGVPAAKQEQLFVPFSRLGQLRIEGHGLGLSIVRRIMETLGGNFGVESTGVPGEGATFYFTLPMVAEQGRSEDVEGSGSETLEAQSTQDR